MLHPLRDAVERWTDGMTALGRQREAKWALQNRNVHEFLRDVLRARPQGGGLFRGIRARPEPTVGALCAGLGIEHAPAVLQRGSRRYR